MKNHLLLLTAALGLTISAMAAPTAQRSPPPPVPNYTLTVIPPLPGATINDTYAYGMNAQGDVAGTSGDHAFLYKKGKLIDIGALFPASLGVTYSNAVAVNAFDEVIGTYSIPAVINGYTYNELAGSFIYYPEGRGRLGLLQNPTGFVTIVHALNDLGQIVGNYGTSAAPDSEYYGYTGYPWLRQVNGTIVPLPLFNGQTVNATAINNLGQIAATGISPNIITLTFYDGVYPYSHPYLVNAPHALLITGQHVQDLMTSVPTTYLGVYPRCVNDFGAVAGMTELVTGYNFDQPFHATLFFAGQVTDFDGVQGPVGNFTGWNYSDGYFYGSSAIFGINDFGTMVGGEGDLWSVGEDAFGTIVVNGVSYDINNYIPNPVVNGVKVDISSCVAINNSGQILAWASYATGSGITDVYPAAYMVIMTPIPVKAMRP